MGCKNEGSSVACCPAGYSQEDIEMEFPKLKCSICEYRHYDSDEGLLYCALLAGEKND